MKAILVGIALIIATGATVPLASADPSEDQGFLATLNRYGVHLNDPVKQGHAVCALLRAHPEYTAMDAAQGFAIYNPSISETDAAYLVGAAVSAYCPSFNHLIRQ